MIDYIRQPYNMNMLIVKYKSGYTRTLFISDNGWKLPNTIKSFMKTATNTTKQAMFDKWYDTIWR